MRYLHNGRVLPLFLVRQTLFVLHSNDVGSEKDSEDKSLLLFDLISVNQNIMATKHFLSLSLYHHV